MMPKAVKRITRRIHIFSNGEVAEIGYFQSFKDHLRSHAITVHKPFKHLSPWDLIDSVIVKKSELTQRGKFFEEDDDECWCVFDIDDYWEENSVEFAKALRRARQNGVDLAWSNECFELWYLLHFQALQTGIPRREYHSKLKQHFRNLDGKNYSKNDCVFSRLLGKQSEAIKHAKQIFQDRKIDNNPSTSVFKLVESINKL